MGSSDHFSSLPRPPGFLQTGSGRLIVAIALVLIGYALHFALLLNRHTEQLTLLRRDEVRRLAQVALTALQPLRDQHAAGEIALEAVRAQAVDLINRLASADEEAGPHLFLADSAGDLLAGSFEGLAAGSSLPDLQSRADISDGGGFVEVDGPPAGSGRPEQALTYVVDLPGWGCLLGARMSAADFEAEEATFRRQAWLLTLSLSVLILAAVGLAFAPTVRAHRQLLELFDQVRRDPDRLPVVDTGPSRVGSERWRLLAGFQEMLRRVDESRRQGQESREQLELTLRATNDGVWDWNLRTDEVYYSPRWKSILGYTEDEVAANFEAWHSLVHPDDREFAMATVRDYLDGRTPIYSLEHRMRHKDGIYRWILARGMMLRDADGRPSRLIGSHMDVTRRREAEEGLREGEEKYRRIVEMANMGIAVVQHGVFRFVNAHLAGMLGYSVDEMIGTKFADHCAPQERERIVSFNARRMRGEEAPSRYETAILHKGGGLVFVDVSVGMVPYEGRQAVHVFLRDITRRREAEAEARRQGEYLAGLHQTALGIMGHLDTTALLEALVGRAVKLVGADSGFIYLATADGAAVETRVGTGMHRKYVGARLRSFEGLSGTVWKTGRPVMVESYADYPNRSPIFSADPIGPAMGVPLRSGAEVVGVLGLTRAIGERAFDESELDVITRFGQLASIALENARLHTAMQAAYESLEQRVAERTRELASLNEVAAVVSRTLDLKAIMTAALDRILASMNMQVGVGYRLRETDGAEDAVHYLDIVTHSGLPASLMTLVDPLPLSGTYVQRSAETGQPAVWDVGEYPNPPVREGLIAEGFRMGISVPLRAKDRLVGAIVIATNQSRPVAPEELSLLAAMGQQIGVAIENARLYEAEQDRRAESERRRRAAEALRDVLTKLNSNQPLQETLGNIAEQASQLLACNAIAFFRLDPASSRLVIQASRGLDEDYIREAAVPVGKGAAGRAIALRQPVVIPDTLATLDEARMWKDDPRWKRLAEQEAQRYRSICAAPLIVRGEPYGAVALYYQSPHAPSQEEIDLAVTFGDQIALAIESASLRQAEREGREEAERRRQVAEALREVLAVLNSGKSLPETLDFIVTQACRVLGSDAASCLRLETPEGPFVIHSACGLDDEYLAALRLPLGIGHTSRAVATRSPAFESDIRRYYEERLSPAWRGESLHPAAIEGLELMLSRGFRSFLAVPLIVGGEAFGAFNLYYRQVRQFSAEEQRLATSVADQAALAIETAGLRQRAGEAAVLAERGRLARELHDSVTQGLYSVTLYAEAAARLLAGGKVSEAVDHLREVGETAQEALREMRLLIFELRPLELEKNGLAGALQARLESVEMRGGMKAELHVHGEAGGLPLQLQEELYHVAREALNNILKHAQARRVDVRLRVTRAACLLEVRDDGVGFEAAKKETGGGLGLRGMRERADRLGADLSIETGPGKGTSITLRIARPHAAPDRPAPAGRRQKGSRP